MLVVFNLQKFDKNFIEKVILIGIKILN